MFIWDFSTGNFIECNKAALLLYGYQKAEFLSLNVKDIRPKEELTKIESIISDESAFTNMGDSGHRGYWTHHTKDRQKIQVEIKANIIDYRGIKSCMVVVNDITESIKTEKALHDSEKEFEKLFNEGLLPQWIYEPESLKILNVNDATVLYYGYTKEEFLKMTLLDLRPKDDIQKFLNKIRKRKDTNGNISLGISTHLKKDGTQIKVEITSQNIDYLGKTCRMVTGLDVTKKERQGNLDFLEKELLQKSLSQNPNFEQTLSDYLEGLEKEFPKMFISILKAEDRKLWSLSAPTLPKEYMDAINGVTIGPTEGSCGTAAYTKKRVIVSDISKNPLWENYKVFALKHNLKSCWSQPIFNSKKEVVATFACYSSSVWEPSEEELDILSRSSSILSLIFENQQKTQEIKASNERYRYVTLATKHAIYDWDVTTGNILWGKGFETLFGYTSNSFKVDFFINNKLIHPSDAEKVGNLLDLFFADDSKENWSSKYRLKKSDGEYAHVEERGFAIRNPKGQVIRMIGVLSDITKETEEEQQLRLAESIIKNTSDAVVITDVGDKDGSEFKIIYSNAAFTKMTGYSADEILGKSPGILVGDYQNPQQAEYFKEIIEKGEPFESTIICNKKTKEEFWNNFSGSPVTDETGSVSNWIFIQRDVTESQNLLIQKNLLSELGQLFNRNENLHTTLQLVLKYLVDFTGFPYSEVWLLSSNKQTLNLTTTLSKDDTLNYSFEKPSELIDYGYGKGLPGMVWETGKSEIWENIDEHPGFIGYKAKQEAGLNKALGIPLIFNQKVIGVLLFLVGDNYTKLKPFKSLIEKLETFLGSEVYRKQLEHQLTSIFNASPDIICIGRLDGYFAKINPAAVDLLEYSEEELMATPYYEFIHPEDRINYKAEFESLMHSKQTTYIEIRLISKSGKSIWFSWSSIFSQDEGLIYAIAKNISKQKELQELLENATKLSKIGGWEVDLINQKIVWSSMTKDIHELEGDDVPHTIEEGVHFYHQAYREQISKILDESIKNGTPFQFEFPLITAKGNEKWVRSIGRPEFKNGMCIRLLGSFQDIHTQKMAEINLNKSIQAIKDYKSALDQSFFIMVTDLNGLLVAVNQHTCTLSGYTEKELIGSNANILSSGFHPKAFFKQMWDKISKGEIWRGDLKNKTKLGKEYWQDTSIAPLKDEKGNIKQYLAICIDITEKKNAEVSLKFLNKNLQRQANDLEVSNAELEQFAYVASHDLQEPLRMVTSFLTRLEKKYAGVLDAKGIQYIGFAVDGAKRMRQIILDLLEYSRAGKENINLQNFDLNEVVREVLLLQKKIILETDAVVVIRDLPTITFYQSPFIQIFNNLINNAIKYRRAGIRPEIEVFGEEFDQEWLISIKDNGIGIEKEYFEKIFVIFQRLHKKEDYSGTGMGLSIVKKTIDNLGGKIWVESTVGQGSTFKFTIPKVKSNL